MNETPRGIGTMQYPDCLLPLSSCFHIKAVSVNREQAIKIAEILFPNTKILDVKFHL